MEIPGTSVNTVLFSPSDPLYGSVQVPGDKSITHRSILFGLLAEGRTVVRGWLDAGDCRSSIQVARQLGAHIDVADTVLTIDGTGGHLKEPNDVLDCGNSGTTMRLFMGAIAARVPFACMTGDSSLRQRPMRRVIDPLRQMGADFHARDHRFAPLCVLGAPLQGLTYRLPMASAQVKSAILIAGVLSQGVTTVVESTPTRDHTEWMLQGFGANVQTIHSDGEHQVRVQGGQTLKGIEVQVPGDISSAAFLLAAATLVEGSQVTIQNVGLNPTRTGFLRVLERMGANLHLRNVRSTAGEAVGDITVRHAKLRGISITAEEVPSMIDELPLIGVLAAFADGRTTIQGAEELRHKETDRIRTLVNGLAQIGAAAVETKDGFIVTGGMKPKGGTVDSEHDHRIAMSFAVAGLACQSGVHVKHWNCVDISFPGFTDVLAKAGASVTL